MTIIAVSGLFIFWEFTINYSRIYDNDISIPKEEQWFLNDYSIIYILYKFVKKYINPFLDKILN